VSVQPGPEHSKPCQLTTLNSTVSGAIAIPQLEMCPSRRLCVQRHDCDLGASDPNAVDRRGRRVLTGAMASLTAWTLAQSPKIL
jgi:hypothetical protein